MVVVVTSFYYKYKNLYSNLSVNAKTQGNIMGEGGLYRTYISYSTYEVLLDVNPESQHSLNRVIASYIYEVSGTRMMNTM